jgi:glyoxylase-like metal-dependent hydrolase (beta-lactamase superfamily II)
MPFLTEQEPVRGNAVTVAPGIRRLVANNPGVMTYHGTNTYLIASENGEIVLDPGPDDAAHIAHIIAAIEGKPALILLSHTHHDHIGGLKALWQHTGAEVAAWHSPAVELKVPFKKLTDNAEIAGLRALHTPGHASDHLCFATVSQQGEKLLFSADHVMSWSSSIVNPPDGSMKDYFASLNRLLDRNDSRYLPGHGPPLPEPRALVRELLTHRVAREKAIAAALAHHTGTTIPNLVETLYSQTNPLLKLAAQRNVLAHLLKLETEGSALRTGDSWYAA